MKRNSCFYDTVFSGTATGFAPANSNWEGDSRMLLIGDALSEPDCAASDCVCQNQVL